MAGRKKVTEYGSDSDSDSDDLEWYARERERAREKERRELLEWANLPRKLRSETAREKAEEELREARLEARRAHKKAIAEAQARELASLEVEAKARELAAAKARVDALAGDEPWCTQTFIWNVVSWDDPAKNVCGHVPRNADTEFFFALLDRYKGDAQAHRLGGHDLCFRNNDEAMDWAQRILRSMNEVDFIAYVDAHGTQDIRFPHDYFEEDFDQDAEDCEHTHWMSEMEEWWARFRCDKFHCLFGTDYDQDEMLTAEALGELERKNVPVKHTAVVTTILEAWVEAYP